MQEELRDNVKTGTWLSRRAEDRLRAKLVPYVPQSIQTYHLTLFTIVWTFGVLIASFLAQFSLLWLLLTSLLIVGHYITDLLDGTIGRLRNTGLVHWGHYMDHFLDFVFFTAIILSYGFIFPLTSFPLIVFIGLMQVGFMIDMFLGFAATKKLDISFIGFGPTEIRAFYIILNLFLIIFGTDLPLTLLPIVAILAYLGLILKVVSTQKALWKLDMDNKASVE